MLLFPAMSLADPLSDVLRSIRLTAGFFCRADFSAPYTVGTGSQPSGIFHAVLSGPPCWLTLEDVDSDGSGAGDGGQPVGDPIRLGPGEVVLLPHGHAHRLSHDAVPCRAESIHSLIAKASQTTDGGLVHVQTGGGNGETTRFLCGNVTFERPTSHPLLAGLPHVVIARNDSSHLGEWIDATLAVLSRELTDTMPGTEAVLTRLADILIVQILRGHVASGADSRPSWLSGLRDPAIRRALGSIHGEPATPWTAETLAQRAGLSRSAFCERFTRFVGDSPGAYLTRWRMHVAATLLEREEASVAEAAHRVGYRSESAFSQAFLRAFGMRPAAYRRAGRVH